MNTFEYALMILPLAVGAWAAWAAPRWAERGHRDEVAHPDGWSAGGLPSVPYRSVHRLP